MDETNEIEITAEELIKAHKIEKHKIMFKKINEIIGRILMPKEKINILRWIKQYNAKNYTVIYAYELAKKKNITNQNYVETLVKRLNKLK